MAGLRLREAEPSDLHTVAALFRSVRETCLPFLPRLHTPEEDVQFFRERVFPHFNLTIAEMNGEIAGYSAVLPGWLEQLYVLPQFQGRALARNCSRAQREVRHLSGFGCSKKTSGHGAFMKITARGPCS